MSNLTGDMKKLTEKVKIVYLPLDERPCNMDFVYKLFNGKFCTISRLEKLGHHKTPADVNEIGEFLLRECADAYGAVISMDMLLYGGLVPSRIHNYDIPTLRKRMDILKKIREENPAIKLFVSHCIMRCPRYSLSEEEPDYYDMYGKEIFAAGVATHKFDLELIPEEEKNEARALIPEDIMKDYENRRMVNRTMNMETLNFIENKIIDVCVYPQDDSARYGYTAIDQKLIRDEITNRGLIGDVLMYPGADEVGLTLTARMLNEYMGATPKVFVQYATEQAKSMFPRYEGVRMGTTIGFHINAAGCIQTSSIEAADIILLVNAPADKMEEAPEQPSLNPEYYAERNMPLLISTLRRYKDTDVIVSFVDNAYSNGGEIGVVRALNKNDLLMAVDGYAGWNTDGNTLGTAIAEAVYSLHAGKENKNRPFLCERYLEDTGYCSIVRGIARARFNNEINSDKEYNDAVKLIGEELEKYKNEYLSSISENVEITCHELPWRRFFEIKLDARYKV